MIKEKAIVIKDLDKEYYKQKSIKSRFLEKLNPKLNSEAFYALKDINLEINNGEVIGVIGLNGSGKSTLLKIIAEVTPPTKGKVEVYGKVASILEIGIGFQPDLSGYENIFLSGRLYGLRNKQIKSKLNEIIEMFGFPDFINTPVKYYSSGMYMRLAFAIITNIEADIYLFDEILSVGDLGFISVVINELEELKNRGATILIVTHTPINIHQICDKIIVLNSGKIDFKGSPIAAILSFKNTIYKNQEIKTSNLNLLNENNLKLLKKSEISTELADFNLLYFSISNSLENITDTVNYEKNIYVKLKFNYFSPENFNIILALLDKNWTVISTTSIKINQSVKLIENESIILIEKNSLNEINLVLSVLIANLDGKIFISYRQLLNIQLVGDKSASNLQGFVNLPIKIIK